MADPDRSSTDSVSRNESYSYPNNGDYDTRNGNSDGVDGFHSSTQIPPAQDAERRELYRKVLNSDIGIDTLLKRLKQSIQSARDFATFLKKKSTLEEKHAQSLKELNRATFELARKPVARQGSFVHSFGDLFNIHERMADNALNYGLKLHEMHDELVEMSNEKERMRKQWKTSGLSSEKRVVDAEQAMDRAKAKYHSLAEDYDRARTGDRQSGRFGLKGPKSAQQVEDDLNRKMQAADTDYLGKVSNAREMTKSLHGEWRPQTTSALEGLIKEMDAALTLQMSKYASFSEKLLVGNGLCISPLGEDGETGNGRSLRETINRIANEQDLISFVTAHSSDMSPTKPEPAYEKHPTQMTPGQIKQAQAQLQERQAQALGPSQGQQQVQSPQGGIRPPQYSQPLYGQQGQAQNVPMPQSQGQRQGLPPGMSVGGDGLSASSAIQQMHQNQMNQRQQAQQQQPPQQYNQQQPQPPMHKATPSSNAPIPLAMRDDPRGYNESQGQGQYPDDRDRRDPYGPPAGGMISPSSVSKALPLSPQHQSQPQMPIQHQQQPSIQQQAPISPPQSQIQQAPPPHQQQPQLSIPIAASTVPSSQPYSPHSALQPAEPPQPRAKPRPVFGISLDALFARDSTAVPMIVQQCLQAVDLFGLDVEGIYRTSGTASHISKLRSLFDSEASSTIDFRNPENFYHDVNSVAGLLKQFFRDLPDPLLTNEAYAAFIESAHVEDDNERRDSLHATINNLPDPNYATLRALMLHLHRVQERSHNNRMNAGNLAICFGPTLMATNNPNIADAGWQVRVIDTILQNTLQIFDDD